MFFRYFFQGQPRAIERTDDGACLVSIDDRKVPLTAVTDPAQLRAILHELLYKEFCSWDYWCDTVGPE